MVEFSNRVITVDGQRVGLLEAGPEDAQPVIFGHCGLAFSGVWKAVIRRLADRWRCIALDFPGHGASGREDRARSLQLQGVEWVEAITPAPAHLVGLSFGGAVMGRVAVKSPHLVKSLTQMEPVWFHLLAENSEWAEENGRLMADVYAACAEGRYREGASAFMNIWGQPGQFERMPPPVQDSVLRALEALASDFNMVDSWPEGQVTREQIAAIAVPVLLVHGERTQESAKAILDEIQALLPHAERFEAKNAGHLSPVDTPDAIADRLAVFFEQAERG